MNVDLIIANVGQLVTCSAGNEPKRGLAMLDVGLIEDGAVAVAGSKIVGVGRSADILASFSADEVFDADGSVVCPGFVDPHTHIVFGGDRLDEFELKVKGSDYLDILAKGGGIISTVRSTRDATLDDLACSGNSRLDKMLASGTTTCEIKTGYGLDPDSEMKMLDVIEKLAGSHPINIVPTFLAAHAVPPEYNGNSEKYVNLISDTMLSSAWKWFVASEFHGKTPFFCDVFCEKGAFSLTQSKKILETAKSLGFKLKAHVDEFTNLGGSRLAIEMGATSIDHLDTISDDEIDLLAHSATVGVVTPTVNFNFGSTHFADARKLVDSGCAVALSTDFNPGSAPCPSQPMTMAIACRYQKLLPAEAINAATINAAFAIGMHNTVGSIEIGKRADLCVLSCRDYRELAYEFGGNLVKRVFSGGVATV